MSSSDGTPGGSLDRRHFCTRVGVGSLVTAAAGSAAVTTSFLSPNVLFEPPRIFDAGRPEDFQPGSVTLFSKQHVFVVCAADGAFYAVSAVCGHLGCIVNWKKEDTIFACPCHGSHFQVTGEVLGGPAPRGLDRYQISLTEERRLIVDASITAGEDTILRV